MSLRQAITTAPRTIVVGQGPEPRDPGPGEVLLSVASVGICGSDIAMWQGSDPYSRFPVRQGHEFSARIMGFGPAYDGELAEGQLVAVEPLLPDGTCVACRLGRPNCCVGLRVLGAHVDGALAERMVVPVANLHPVGDLTPDQAAFVEPVSIGLQMVSRSRAAVGDQAVILGAGPIGQAVQLAALDRGVRVLSVDLLSGRLARSLENGAELTVDARDPELDRRILGWTDGDGPRIVFEATGVAAVLRRAFDIAAHAGTVVVAGTPAEDVTLPVLAIVRKELDVLGSRNNTGLFPAAVSLVQRQQARCESLITQRFPIGETQAAMEFGAANPGAVNKLMIQVAG